MAVPVTERPNPLSHAIDVASPQGILSILNSIDLQIFDGWSEGSHRFPSLHDLDGVITTITEKLATLIRHHAESTVVLSGCGTSGRIAWMTARRMNQLLKSAGKTPSCRYLIASGDAALLIGQEQGEDDPHRAEADIVSIVNSLPCSPSQRLLYIGITCGLSAPYVASQLHYLMHKAPAQLDITGVLLGFNPTEMARNVPVYDRTVYSVVKELNALSSTSHRTFAILNPIVGPEAITGSSRMKGGSATKVLLDAIFCGALAAALPEWWHSHVGFVTSPRAIIDAFHKTVHEFYANAESLQQLSELLKRVAESLATGNNGHLYYVCTDPSLGILAVIDASECPPTYGSRIEDVRAFVARGWKDLATISGDLSSLGVPYCISIDDFQKSIQPTLSAVDTVVLITGDGSEASEMAGLKNLASRPYIALLRIGSETLKPSSYDLTIDFKISSLGGRGIPCLQELALKLALNGITTGAHVLKGKIFENRMIDVRISNNKILHRAIGIVARCAKVAEKEARIAVLKAAHNSDTLTQEVVDSQDPAIIDVAFKVELVVPRAILVASGRYTVAQAAERLKSEPIVAKILRNSS